MIKAVCKRFLVLAAVALGMLVFASPAWAADYVVNYNVQDLPDPNPGDGSCDVFPNTPGTQCTLRAAVDDVNRRALGRGGNNYVADTISFDLPANFGNTIRLNSSLTIGGLDGFLTAVDLTIQAPEGTRINMFTANGDRVFTVFLRARATMERLAISGGRLQGANGGAIYNGGTLTLRDVVLTNNEIVDGPNNNRASGGAIFNSGDLTVAGSTISSNHGSEGGGISNSRGNLTLRNSTVSGNSSREGGGVYAYGDSSGTGTVTVENSTISGNTTGDANAAGGGILNWSSKVTVKNSTVTGNSAPNGRGAGIANVRGGTVSPPPATTISSSIVSANRAPAGGAATDVDNTNDGAFTSGDYNLIGTGNATGSFDQPTDQTGVTDPKLGPLQDNGGPTRTHLPAPDSPAVDAGNEFTGLGTDQRGALRPQDDPDAANAAGGDGSEVGSVELETDPPPSLSIADASVTEGNSGTTNATFTLTLSRPAAGTVTVAYATTSGTATSPGDYASTSGTATFRAGQTQAEVTVPVVGDIADEPEETFSLVLSNSQNATLTDASATATIADDDPPPSVSIDDTTVTEGDSGTTDATFIVSLSSPSERQVGLDYATADGDATAGADYTAKNGALSFAPGNTRRSVTISVNPDTLDEPDETFFVDLTNPSNATTGDARGAGTITDDDSTPQATGDGSTDNPIAVDEDDPNGVTTDVLANDTGLGDAPVTVEVSSPPNKGAATVNADGAVTYRPGAEETGDDFYAYTVTDSDGQTSTAIVFLRIAARNDAPVVDLSPSNAGATGDSAAFTEGGGPVPADTNSDLSVTDVDDAELEGAAVRISNPGPADSLTADTSGAPITATRYDAAAGVLVLSGAAPKADYERVLRTIRYNNTSQDPGTAGRRVEFTVDDGDKRSEAATSNVAVRAVNDAPRARNDSLSVGRRGSAAVAVLSNDSDPDGDRLNVSGFSRPAHGSVTRGAGGALLYTPDAGYSGADRFTYIASDGNGATDEATVSVSVADTTTPTLVSAGERQTLAGGRRTLALEARFSEAMKAGTVNGRTFSLSRGGDRVAAVVRYEPGAKKAVLTPRRPLEPGVRYTATVERGMKDLSGNALDRGKRWTFTLDRQGTGRP